MIELPRSAVEDAAWDADLDIEEDLRFDYSGRGMYGAKCFGIVGDDTKFLKFLIKFAEREPDLAWELTDRVATDSMGREAIMYFVGATVVDKEDED